MKSSHARNRWLSTGLLIAFATTTSAAVQAADQLVQMYELIELEADGGGPTRAYAVNNTGQIVGWIIVDELKHSAQWHNRVTTDLHGTVHFALKHPVFDQDYGEAFDISNGGQVVGTARTVVDCDPTDILCTHAFVLRPAVLTDLATPYAGDALTNLITLGNPCIAHDSAATAISNSNHVVGWADRTDGVIHAFLVVPVDGQFYRDEDIDWVNDLMIDLGTLAADADPVSGASAVNDSGEVTGYSYTTLADGTVAYHAFLVMPVDADLDGVDDTWFVGDSGVNNLMVDLETLGGTNSWGRDINNNGEIVGESDFDASTGEHYTRAFLWIDGTMTDLGTLRDNPNHGFSSASAINDNGAVVGWAENENRERHAFIYENGQIKDLNDLLFLLNDEGFAVIPSITLTEARDINDDGVIVGWGVIHGADSNETRGFLLNPVLIDPSILEQQEEEEQEDDSGEGATATEGGGEDFTGQPVFGVSDGTVTEGPADEDADVEPTPAPAPSIVLCGTGSLTLLPLTLAGLCWFRGSNRRK